MLGGFFNILQINLRWKNKNPNIPRKITITEFYYYGAVTIKGFSPVNDARTIVLLPRLVLIEPPKYEIISVRRFEGKDLEI